MNLTYRENYWDDPPAKKEFIGFLINIHRLDLSLWDRMECWDWNYRPFSYFDGPTLVSNVCVYSMDMTVEGERRRVAQISAVGTLPEHRRKGLNRQLTDRAMEWASANHDFFFLFADEDARPYYKACGFRPVDEYKTRIAVSGKAARAGARRLDMQRKDHRELVYRCATDRAPVSDLLGVRNRELLMFWCLYFLRDNIYYIEDLDVLVIYERKDGRVSLFDIVGLAIPPFADIYPYICASNDTTAEFLFMPDRMRLGKYDEVMLAPDNGTFLYGDFPLEGRKFIFPYTAHA